MDLPACQIFLENRVELSNIPIVIKDQILSSYPDDSGILVLKIFSDLCLIILDTKIE